MSENIVYIYINQYPLNKKQGEIMKILTKQKEHIKKLIIIKVGEVNTFF